MNSQNIDADFSDITRKTGKKDFLQESNKKNTNHPNIVKIKKKKKDKAPIFHFQLCSCKVDNRIRKLDS